MLAKPTNFFELDEISKIHFSFGPDLYVRRLHQVAGLFDDNNAQAIRSSDLDLMVRGKGVALLHYQRAIGTTLRSIAPICERSLQELYVLKLRRGVLKSSMRDIEVAQSCSLLISDANWKSLNDRLSACEWGFVEAQVYARATVKAFGLAINKLQYEVQQYLTWSRQAPRKERAEVAKRLEQVRVVLGELGEQCRLAESEVELSPIDLNAPGIGHFYFKWLTERELVRRIISEECQKAMALNVAASAAAELHQ